MSEIVYNPLPFQEKFHNSTKPKVYLSAGLGAGKTYSLGMKAFQLMDLNPGLPGGLLVPNLKMYKRDVLPTIEAICDENGIVPRYNKTDMVWKFRETRSTMYVYHSEDDGKSIKGANLAWGLINEITLCSKLAVLALFGRMRLKNATLLQVAMSGTPEGFDWCYDYFIENPREDTDLIYGNVRDNVHNAETYVRMLEESYDPLMQKQYIDGQFLNLNKKACLYSFDRRKHGDDTIEKLDGYPVWVNVDFNVSPMAATLWNRVPFTTEPGRDEDRFDHFLRGFDELCIESSNTYELCDEIKRRVQRDDEVTIYPDPAGVARSTQSRGRTDIDILRDAFGAENVKYKSKIRVRDCLNAANRFVARDLMRINRKKCKNTVADFEQCTFREGVFEIDKTNQKRSHWLDGFKNMIDFEFPVQGRRQHRIERMR